MTNEFVNAGSVKRYDSARGIALHYPISFVFFDVQINIRENPRDTWRISVVKLMYVCSYVFNLFSPPFGGVGGGQKIAPVSRPGH